MKINLIQTAKSRISAKILQSFLQRLVKHYFRLSPLPKKQNAQVLRKEMSVRFVAPQEMKRLNKTYRGKAYATDVLSFSAEGDWLGDLVLCPQVIRRQSQEQQWSYQLELGYMLVHGFLHLLGHDHERSQSQAKKMFRLQNALFESLSETRLLAKDLKGKSPEHSYEYGNRNLRRQKSHSKSTDPRRRTTGVSLTSKRKKSV